MEGGPITNVWHQEVVLAEPVVRFILARLDGHASAGEVARAVREQQGDRVTEAEAAAIVQASLEMLAKAAVLLA